MSAPALLPQFSPTSDDVVLMGRIAFWCIRHRLILWIEWYPEGEDDPTPWYGSLRSEDDCHREVDWVGVSPMELACLLVERWRDQFGGIVPDVVVTFLDQLEAAQESGG